MHRKETCDIKTPLVSVTMGVYNAEKFLAASIQSILDQDYQNFELIISDNGSTDRSGEMCRLFAEQDARILYRRNESNINPMKNAKILLDLSSGVYLHGAADHDLYHPRYLSSLVDLLELGGESVAMAYPDTQYIDIDGKPITDIQEDVETRNLSVSERFIKTMWGLTFCTPMYGLFRLSTLKKVWKMRSVTGPDRVLLNELSLSGEFAHHQEKLFFMRRNRPAETHVESKRRQSRLFVGSAYESLVPSIMKDHALMEVVADSELDTFEKEKLTEEIIRYHHANPSKNSTSEVESLTLYGMNQLASGVNDEKEKRSAAGECLRIAAISRMFCAEMSPQLDQLTAVCETVISDDRRLSGHIRNFPDVSEGSLGYSSDTSLKSPVRQTGAMPAQYEERPILSIGMTIYNQEKFIEKTIESILGQDFGDFELCIIENASEDRSFDICRRYAKMDKRIRIVRNPFNIGRVASFDQVLKQCSGENFMFASGHDLYHRSCLSRLIDQFNDCGQSVSMVVPGAALIDMQDHLIENQAVQLPDTQGQSVVERYKRIIWNFRLGSLSGSLFRTAMLREVWDPFNVRGSMHIIPAQLSLMGANVRLNDTLLFKRMRTGKKDQYPRSTSNPHLNSLTIHNSETTMPYTMLAYEHIHMVRKSSLEPSIKKSLYKEIKKCFSRRFNLHEEALAFLKSGVETIEAISRQPVYPEKTMATLTELSNVCSFFQDHQQHVFDRFNHLILHLTPN